MPRVKAEKWDWSDFSLTDEEKLARFSVKQAESRRNQKAKVTHQIALTIVSVFCLYVMLQLLFGKTVNIHPGFLSIVSMVLGFYFGDKISKT